MVNRLVWTNRTIGVQADAVDNYLRDFGAVSLPKGKPTEGWKRETGKVVELCAEQFPGSSPVWIWQE